MAMVASSSSSSSSSWVVVLFMLSFFSLIRGKALPRGVSPLVVLFMLSFFSLIRGKALPRGISPLDSAYFLGIDSVIKCRDGSSSFPLHRLNDDFCDCPDGTDEPGTSACPEGRFYCNHLKKNRSIFSSRVNDGICDCCDGSDEYNGKIKCPNNCREGDSESLESGFTTEALSTRDMSGVMYDTDRLHQHEELGLSIIKGGRKINDLFDLNRDFKEVAVLEISLVVFVFVVLSWWKFCRHKWIYKPQQKRVRVI